MTLSLTAAMKRALTELVTLEKASEQFAEAHWEDETEEPAEIVCDGGQCFIGARRIARRTVDDLISVTAISASQFGGGTEVYTLNETGRSILRRPELIQELHAALASGGSFTITDDKLVPMSSPHGA